MKHIPVIALTATLALAACATPRSRVESALLDAGLSRPVAQCMAQRMTSQLSISQLQKLSRLKGDGRALSELPLRELYRRAESLGDPEIVRVVTSAGLRCAIAAG